MRGVLTFIIMIVMASCAFADTPESQTATVTIDEVAYILPTAAHWKPDPKISNPYEYVYEYMHVKIQDRQLFINGQCRFKAKPGDKVIVTYVPNDVIVNGVKVQDPHTEACS